MSLFIFTAKLGDEGANVISSQKKPEIQKLQ